jgi:arylsulfatase
LGQRLCARRRHPGADDRLLAGPYPGRQGIHISVFYDVLPTLCEAAGLPAPKGTDGISFLPELLGRKKQKQHEYVYWEFPEYNGQQAVRIGNWKALRMEMQKGNTEIQLFDLSTDTKEQNNVASAHPEIVQKALDIMKAEHRKAALQRFYIKAIDQ